MDIFIYRYRSSRQHYSYK